MKTLYLASKTIEDVCVWKYEYIIYFNVGFKHTMLKWSGLFHDYYKKLGIGVKHFTIST